MIERGREVGGGWWRRAARRRDSGRDRAWCALAPLGALDRARLLEPDHHDERLELLCDLTDAVATDARGLLAGGGPLS